MAAHVNTQSSTDGLAACWGGDDDAYLSVQHSNETHDWSLPTEHPLLWTFEQQTHAEACAMLFSSEYMFDFDARKALIRLGADPEACRFLVKQYMTHPLVQRFIRHRMQNFTRQNVLTQDTVLAWIYQEATDKSPFSNPLARVKAQQILAKHLKLEGQDESTKVAVMNGGVMLVGQMETAEAWEKQASEAQRKLQETA